MELKNILTGFYKLAVKEATEVQLENIARCHSCTLFDDGYCSKKRSAVHIKTGQTVNGCGCYVPAKARTDSKCPLGKWEESASLSMNIDFHTLGTYKGDNVSIAFRDMKHPPEGYLILPVTSEDELAAYMSGSMDMKMASTYEGKLVSDLMLRYSISQEDAMGIMTVYWEWTKTMK